MWCCKNKYTLGENWEDLKIRGKQPSVDAGEAPNVPAARLRIDRVALAAIVVMMNRQGILQSPSVAPMIDTRIAMQPVMKANCAIPSQSQSPNGSLSICITPYFMI